MCNSRSPARNDLRYDYLCKRGCFIQVDVQSRGGDDESIRCKVDRFVPAPFREREAPQARRQGRRLILTGKEDPRAPC